MRQNQQVSDLPAKPLIKGHEPQPASDGKGGKI
jgi:hypothetical protein